MNVTMTMFMESHLKSFIAQTVLSQEFSDDNHCNARDLVSFTKSIPRSTRP